MGGLELGKLLCQSTLTATGEGLPQIASYVIRNRYM